MLDGAVLSPDKCYRAKNTIFGWIIGGDGGVEPPTATCLRLTAVQETPEKLMKTIWELDQAPYYEEFNSLEDLQAKEDFQDSHSRLPSGRYVVTLPRRKPAVELGESRSLAMKRFHQNEKTLLRRNQLAAYTQVVQEYLDLDHAEVVPKDELCRAPGKCYYFPMFGVSKLDSTTTKLRAVCDASAPTSTGYSLNDSLLSGPSLHPMLSSVITRFRRHRLGMVGDVSKMFREVALRKDEYDFHRFLHRGDSGDILDCRMKRLTFGVTSSPYLASQVLHQMAQDHGAEHPKAAQLIAQSFYVDDVLTGADNVKDAIQLRQELNQLLAKGCMILRKWRTNSPELKSSIPEELQDQKALPIQPEEKDYAKALGIHWDDVKDVFYVAVPHISMEGKITKRGLASGLAKVFDLMGWLCSAILPMKIALQDCWRLNLTWDDELPADMSKKWTA